MDASRKLSVTFGPSNTEEFPADDYPTLGDLLQCRRVRQKMGFGDNVEGLVNGATGVTALRAGDTIEVISKANKKG